MQPQSKPMVAPWKKIKSALRERGMTQKEMACLVGVSTQAVQKWKNGGSMSFESLEKVADVLGTTVGCLLEYPETIPSEMVLQESSEVCRYPDGCDLDGRLRGVEAGLYDMGIKLDTLCELLSAIAARGVNDHKQAG